jgi:cytochrome c oxidase assembly protein subunit 15
LSRFAWLTAAATWLLVGLGGLVTSKGVGMAVPDWPTSYGYNMFALPFSTWLTGGVFDEHTHRVWASLVGTLVVMLTRWLGGCPSRRMLVLIGLSETLTGLLLPALGESWKGAGYFLSGIGGVVLLAGIIWADSPRSTAPLPALGWTAFVLVQLQGLLGGLRVVLDSYLVADVRLGTAFGILHGCLGQIFLVVLVVIAVFAGGWWRNSVLPAAEAFRAARRETGGTRAVGGVSTGRRLALAGTLLIFLQLMLGAAMRHQHAGLAVPDFPTAYGGWYPATDDDSLRRYNAERTDQREFNPITAFQIHLHMAHRLTGLLLVGLVPLAAWRFRREAGPAKLPGSRVAAGWAALIIVQGLLGMLTVLLNKPADIATAHVMIGALCLVTGSVLVLVTGEFSIATVRPVMQSRAHSLAHPTPQTLT